MSHEEYVAWQHLYHMTDYEKEQIDTITTCLMNLGYTADNARRDTLCLYRDLPTRKASNVA
jgi:hypothetical protein